MEEQTAGTIDLSVVTTEIEQLYETAMEFLREETQRAKEYLTNEAACRKIWEDNSTIIPHFERKYQEYATAYKFREKCGKIAQTLAAAFQKIEEELPKKFPVQTIEIPFPSPWTERIFDCVQKKRQKKEDLWEQMGDAYWEETRVRTQAQAIKKLEQEAEICAQSLKKIKEAELKMISQA
ncbi:MAG: hypothetical protein ACI4HI_07335 [Lachnospiraceae bacterium]